MSELIIGYVNEFFAPASTTPIDSLVSRYRRDRKAIEEFSEFLRDPNNRSTLRYFLNASNEGRGTPSVDNIFNTPKTIKYLDACYWQQAISLTDVRECMPNKTRNDWDEQIRESNTPEFEEATVKNTLMELLHSRQKFFAERVDGIFKALSGEHVTNRPEGFSKRMIISGMYYSHGGTNYETKGYLQDLMKVIGKFINREYVLNDVDKSVDLARAKTGEWVNVVGGILRIRAYQKGTIHLDVHPEIAYKLNDILAFLYPNAIPSAFRKKPTKKSKDHVLIDKLLPENLLKALNQYEVARTNAYRDYYDNKIVEPLTHNRNNLWLKGTIQDTYLRKECEKILEQIGGVKRSNGKTYWFEFDYYPEYVLKEIIVSGCIPDYKSYQFYPTPQELAQRCVDLAEIDNDHLVLEPSAGVGNIADCFPNKSNVLCVEISSLHCKILGEKGFTYQEEDFLIFAKKIENCNKFDRVVMNPPFSDGRALSHLQAAYDCLKEGGRLVAILPESYQGKTLVDKSKSCVYSEVIKNEFANTSVSVVIVTIDK